MDKLIDLVLAEGIDQKQGAANQSRAAQHDRAQRQVSHRDALKDALLYHIPVPVLVVRPFQFRGEAVELAAHGVGGGGDRLYVALDVENSRMVLFDQISDIQNVGTEGLVCIRGALVPACHYAATRVR